MQHFDIETLSRQTGISPVKLEYCRSHKLGERDWFFTQNSSSDTIDEIAAVHLILAANLLDLGCKIDAIRWILRAIAGFTLPQKNPLHVPCIGTAIQSKLRASVQFADGTHVRWKIGTDDTGWYKYAPTVAADPDHDPIMVVAFDVARVRDLVQGPTA
jgi:hypothetical protein